MMTKKLTKIALAGLAFAAALRMQAATNVIYFDPFTTAAGSPINGTTPADHGGVGTDAWTAPDDGIVMDGSTLTVTSGSRWCSLPFYPEEGNKYKISMDMNATHTGDDWFAIGFCNSPTPVADYGAQQMSGWYLIRGLNAGYPLHSFTGYATDGGGEAGNYTGPHRIAVILDTTVANWTFQYFVDDEPQRGPVAFSKTPDVNPSISSVTFGSYNTARGIMDNFRLENILHVETGAPTIATQPKDQTVLVGGTVKFEVLAAGPKPITYQWYKKDQLIDGEIGSSLLLTGLTAADNNAKFTVKVTNSYGTTTTTAATLTVLNVTGPLIHKFNFTDGTLNDTIGGMTGVLKGKAAVSSGQLALDGSEGGYVFLSDYAMPPAGSATVVAWFRASSTIGKSARVFDFGSSSLNYFFFTPMTDAGGTAKFGFKAGDDAEVGITYTPTLNDDQDHMVAAVVDSTPTDTGANGSVTLYIDGNPVGTNDLNGMTMLANLDFGPQNYFGKSQWVNTGDRPFKGFIDEVRVYNTALSQTAIAALTPDANPDSKPVIDTQPKDTVASLGGSASLLVGATGSKPITYTWRLNGNDIAGSNTNLFTLTNVKSTDLGGYDVVIANSLGSVTSIVAQVALQRWSYEAWNDDATSGVDTNYFYTHAYNFGAATTANINGLDFIGVAGGNPSVANSFTLTGVGNVFANDANFIPDGTGSRILANDFIYGGNPGTLTLTGLLPGKEYLLTLFAVAFESPGNRRITFAAAGGQSLLVDQDVFDNDNGIRISYQYTADTNGSVTVTTTPIVAGNTHHSYGFCNRLLNKVGTDVAPEITAQPQDTSAAVGSAAGFTVTALGTAPLKYQWRLNGDNIAGATSSTYTNDNVQASNFGAYTVVVANNFGSVTSVVAQLSLLRFSHTNWVDDATSGIDSKYVYTHAYNFGSAVSPTINGVKFTGIAGVNPSVPNVFTLTGVPSVYNNDANNVNDTGSRTMANDFLYGGAPGVLTLYGLTPGNQYLLTLYSMGWEDSGRVIKFTAAGGQQYIVDQDTYLNDNGIEILYQYTADANGSVWVSTAQAGAAGTFHTYGFSNREIPGGAKPPQLTITIPTSGSVTISWPASYTGYVLESTGALPATTWTPVSGVQNNQATIVHSKAGNQFYRLRKP